MHVEVNASNGIKATENLELWAKEYLNDHLSRFNQDVTTIEVQFTDENHGAKGGGHDKRCMMEARMNGRAPVAVTNWAENQDAAFRGAADKLIKALDHVFGKLDRHQHRDRETIRRDPEVLAEMPPVE